MSDSNAPDTEESDELKLEEARLKALKSYDLLDTEPEQAFDDITQIAAELCDVPIALISLVDETRQWFKSRVGLEVEETPRDIAFCNEAIKGFSLLEIPDSQDDDRFRNNPLVTGDTDVRYYAGVPLTAAEGHNLGTLCVIDHKPRTLTKTKKAALQALALSVVNQFESRRALQESERTRAELAAEVEKRKLSEEKKKRAEQFLHQSLNAVQDHIAIVNGHSEIVFVNEAWKSFAEGNALAGREAGFELGSNYLHVCEQSSANGSREANDVASAIRSALGDGEFTSASIEYPCHSPTEQRWFVATISPLTIESQPYAVITHHNITQRKLAELELNELAKELEIRVQKRTQELSSAYSDLRNSEEKYRALFEYSTVAFSIASANGDLIDVNPAFCALVGRGPSELIGNKVYSYVDPDDHENFRQLRTEVLSGASMGFIRDVHIVRPNGTSVWGRASVAAIRDQFGTPAQTMTLIQDFTDQRAAERERDLVFERSVDMFAIIRFDGEIVQVNPSATRTIGIPAKQLTGMNISEFVHPEDLEKARQILQTMATTSETLPALEIRMRIKGGEYRDIRWSGSRQDTEKLLIAVGRDVTRSRNSERALHRLASRLQEIREEERTRISREIHDELGQILTALKIDLDLLSRDIGNIDDQRLSENVDSIKVMLNSTLTSVKRIAQDLRPEVLDALGLVPALEWQAKETHERTGLDCEITCDQDIPALDGEQTTQLFRIIQEALTNVVRHADSTYARVLIEVTGQDILKITIQDNGKGFNVVEAESQSLGILGMKERAQNIGATLNFTSADQKGTTVTLELPTQQSS